MRRPCSHVPVASNCLREIKLGDDLVGSAAYAWAWRAQSQMTRVQLNGLGYSIMLCCEEAPIIPHVCGDDAPCLCSANDGSCAAALHPQSHLLCSPLSCLKHRNNLKRLQTPRRSNGLEYYLIVMFIFCRRHKLSWRKSLLGLVFSPTVGVARLRMVRHPQLRGQGGCGWTGSDRDAGARPSSAVW